MEGAVCPVCSADGMWLMEKDEETLKGGGFLKIVSYDECVPGSGDCAGFVD